MSDSGRGYPRLDEFFAGRGLRVSRHQARQLNLYLDQLEEWNRKINLTGLSSRQRIVDELLVDSVLPSPFLPEQGALLDVGSGAGFPAIPIKICKPRLTCRLLEPNSKKISFLRHIIRVLGLRDIEAAAIRIEDHAETLYDVITSRAFAPLPRLATLCAPCLAPSGRLVAFLGRKSDSIIKESERLLQTYNLFPFKRIAYSAGEKGGRREILILEKQS